MKRRMVTRLVALSIVEISLAACASSGRFSLGNWQRCTTRRAAHRDRFDGRRAGISQRILGHSHRRSRARRHAVLAQRGQAVPAGVEHEGRHELSGARAAWSRLHLSHHARRARTAARQHACGRPRRDRPRRSDGQRSHVGRRDDPAPRDGRFARRARRQTTSPAASSRREMRFPDPCSATAGRGTISSRRTPRHRRAALQRGIQRDPTCMAAPNPAIRCESRLRPAHSFPALRTELATIALRLLPREIRRSASPCPVVPRAHRPAA